ncbi:MAG TPA: hypothetical protein VFS48_00305 [Solirubrobacterales bacterium]|nr:hypothetical protein [Solirubrobacterales bacterium]
MRTLRGTVALGMLIVVAVAGAPSASAAIEIGDECTGNAAEGPYSLVPEERASGGALPLVAPAGGVVTSWKVNSAHPEPVFERMAAFRATGKAGVFQVIGESSEETVSPGANTFPTRIPIQAGDRFGPVAVELDSPLFCSTGDDGDRTWAFVGSAGLGSTHQYKAGVQVRVPLVAVIEPDKDGDGYGDETQDKCPQSAAYQGPCPTITLEAFPIALKRSVLVLVSASSESSIQVFGQVGWKRRHRGGALASKTRKPGDQLGTGVIVGLAGGTQSLKPGEIGRFNVKLPKSVKRQLRQVPSGKSLKGTISARTTDLTGQVVERTIAIRLPGQKRHP